MNKFELIAKLIVPAFFVIVWIINQLTNKETPATPVRGGRPVGPPGARPPAPPLQSEEDRAFATADPRTGAWPQNRPPAAAGPDEIVILGTEHVRRSPPARAVTSGPGGRAAKGARRASRPPDAKTAVPQRLGGNISQSVNQSIQHQPLDMKSITQSQPLSMATNLGADHASSTMVSATASVAGSSGPIAEGLRPPRRHRLPRPHPRSLPPQRTPPTPEGDPEPDGASLSF